MPVDIAKMRANPKFAELSYAEQRDLTRQALIMRMREDATMQQFNDADREDIASQASATYTPVLRGDKNVVLTDADRARFAYTRAPTAEANDETKYVLWLAEETRKGNTEAQDIASKWVRNKVLVNETLTGKIVAGGKDIYELIRYADRDLDYGFDSDAVGKMTEYIAASMPDKQEGATLLSRAKTLGMLAGMAETVALNLVLVGSYSGFKAGATAAKAGQKLLPVFHGGLLTRGLYAAADDALVKAAPGITRLAAKGFASYGVEALGSAAIDVLRSLPEGIADGYYQGNAKFWSHTARTFGEGLAYDVVFNVAADVARAVIAPVGKIFFGKRFDLTRPESVKALNRAVTQASDPDTIKALTAGVIDGRIPQDILMQQHELVQKRLLDASARMRALERVAPDRRDTDGFLQLYGKASGYDVEPVKNGYLVSRDGVAVTSAASRGDAFSWLEANGKEHIDVDDLARPYVGQDTARVVTRLRGTANPKQFSDDTLLGMAVATKDGTVDAKTARLALGTMLEREGVDVKALGLRSATTDEDTFLKRVANPQKLIADKPDILVVPRTMTKPGTREAFLDYMTSFGRSKAPGFRNLGMEYAEKHTLSPLALQVAAKKLPEGALLESGGVFRLSYRGADGQLVEQVLQNTDQANIAVSRALIDNGVLSEDEIFKQVYKESGVAIEPETSEFGTKFYIARDTQGTVIASSDSLTGLFKERPALWPRLPEQLGPELYYLGGKRFELRRTVATGPYSDLSKLMDNFGASRVPASWKVLETNAEKRVRIRAPRGERVASSFAVELDGLGYQTEFATLKKAKEFVARDLETWESVRGIAAQKGYIIEAGPQASRTLLVSSIDGTTNAVVKSLDEAREYVARAPVALAQKELFTALDSAIDDEIVNSARRALETDATAVPRAITKPLDDQAKALDRVALGNTIDSLVAPAYSALERMGKRLGRPDLPVNARKLNASTRAMGAAVLRSQRAIRAIASPGGKLLSKNTNEILGRILTEGPERWADAAKQLGLELTPQHRAVLNASRAYYDRLGEVFGIDAWRYLTDYAPKIRSAVTDFRAQGALGKITKNELMTRTFGQGWRNIPEVRFFAQHTRLDNFLDATKNRMGLVDQMVQYTEQGYRELYLGPLQQQLGDWYKELAGLELQPAVQKRITSLFEQVMGGVQQDWLDRELRTTSLALSTKIADGVRKLEGVFPKRFARGLERLANNLETPDVAGKLSAMVTHATLGFRPFRGVSNMAQYMNTYAVFGDDAIDAMEQVTSKQIEELFQKGIIQEKVFASSAKGIGETNALLEAGLRAQQQSEYLTRAWTADAAGRSFDLGLRRLGAGSINWDQFVKESKLNLLDQTGIDTVLGHLKTGNADAGKALFQAEAVRILMFDYAKENYPLAFKGVVGRAFGKFGIYPVGQVDLYRRILGSGSAGERVLRATRLIASSVLIYNAFKAVGVDYSGFLWNDAFSFSGGPMFSSASNLLNANVLEIPKAVLHKQFGMFPGYEASPTENMSRRDLARSFLPGFDSDGNFTVPRLVVPGALEINALIKAGNIADDDPYFAALTALGATTSKDWLRGGLDLW